MKKYRIDLNSDDYPVEDPNGHFYLCSEADLVIAQKDEEIERLRAIIQERKDQDADDLYERNTRE